MTPRGKFLELAEAGFTNEQIGVWGAVTKYLLTRAGLSDEEIYDIFLGVSVKSESPIPTPEWPFNTPAPDWWH